MQKRLTLKQRIGGYLISRMPVTRENFDRLRFELNAFRININNRINPFAIYKVLRQRSKTGLSVNIGSGPFGLEGWVNIDMFSLDQPVHKSYSLYVDCIK
jgi:hypothetical protein